MLVPAAGLFTLGWRLADAGYRQVGEWVQEVPSQILCLLAVGYLLSTLAHGGYVWWARLRSRSPYFPG